MNCKDVQENLPIYLYHDLPADELGACETHLAACEACRARLVELRQLHQLLGGRAAPEASPQMLARCRLALEEAIDRELERVSWRSLLEDLAAAFRAASPFRAVAALTLVVFGFGLGWTLRPRLPGLRLGGDRGPGEMESNITGSDFGNLRINNISQVTPDPATGEVRITVDAERRMTLQGSLDNPHIRQVLIGAVKGYENAGIRRDVLDALRMDSDNPSVRDALLYAIQKDPNDGVRLEALEAVHSMGWNPQVRQALLQALGHDTNAGMRVAAIDALVEHADETVLPALERLAASDPNRYVRMKSLIAVRKLQGDGF